MLEVVPPMVGVWGLGCVCLYVCLFVVSCLRACKVVVCLAMFVAKGCSLYLCMCLVTDALVVCYCLSL